MANEVRFKDNSIQVKRALKGAIEAYLKKQAAKLSVRSAKHTS